jgi:hypothetical protein
LHVNWSDFSDGIKLVVIRELCREMPFYDAASFIQLEDSEIKEFIRIVEREIASQDGEGERIARANNRQTELIMSGNTAQAREEWEAFMEEEIHGEHSWEPALFSISRDDVERAKLFLRDFRYREEFPEYDPKTTPAHAIEEMNAIPPYLTLQSIISRLSTYEGVAVTFVSLEFERGLLDMFFEAEQFMEEYNHRANLGELDNPEDMPGEEYEESDNLDSVQPQEQEQPNNLNRFQAKEHEQPHNLDSLRPRQYKKPRKSVGFESDAYEEPEDPAQDDDAAFEPERKKKKKKASAKRTTTKDKEAIDSGVKKPTKKHNPKPKLKATLPPSRLREVTNAQEDETPEPSRTSALFPTATPENAINSAVLVDGSASGKSTLERLLGPGHRAIQPPNQAREQSTAAEPSTTTQR